MIPQTLPDFPPRTRPFDVSATVRDTGGGIFVVCACICVCVCVCFKAAVWFSSELTRASEVIKILWWRRPTARLLWLYKVRRKEMVCVVTCVYVPVCACAGGQE